MHTLTLKNIPENVHTTLKQSAAKNRRSLNNEILARLECNAVVARVDTTRLARQLKAFTDRLPRVDHRIGDRETRKGRK